MYIDRKFHETKPNWYALLRSLLFHCNLVENSLAISLFYYSTVVRVQVLLVHDPVQALCLYTIRFYLPGNCPITKCFYITKLL